MLIVEKTSKLSLLFLSRNILNDTASLLTGITPSGSLHLGSYLGTMQSWKAYTQQYQCWFFIADMHAITVAQPPAELSDNTLTTAALYLAMGLDVKKHGFFVQSHVPQHAELSWVLSCIANTGEMNRMTQFKDKSTTAKKPSSLGLYAYPCLMAADILLYDAKYVPVGEDQKQHLELTRNIAMRFNRDYQEVFTVPDPVIPKVGARVMALGDPTKKMSKSDTSTNNTVFLLDEPKVIEKKIKRAVTDSLTTIEHDPKRPGISNLVSIYAALNQQEISKVVDTYHDKGYQVFKSDLAELVISHMQPIQEMYKKIIVDKAYLHSVLKEGRDKAQNKAQKKLKAVYEAVGFLADAK